MGEERGDEGGVKRRWVESGCWGEGRGVGGGGVREEEKRAGIREDGWGWVVKVGG